ncbi:O-antigen ligase family protein [Alkaliphilus metalliredigens]|uniref:O-antigen ligase family protein n=1 Tax=Alkaliphilus metalliredigens TaxID=208226 RepID=UPI00005CACE5|nr:O-antigen ligase family protein [Alkaliphilus metalliredigens]
MLTKGTKGKTKAGVTKQSKRQSVLLFILLGVLVFYPPFFRGLFFERERLLTHALSFGLFMTYLMDQIIKGEKIDVNSPFDYIGGLLIFAYVLPVVFFQWANLREAVGMILWQVNLFVVYFMVKEYAQEEKYRRWILDIVLLSGVITAIVGILGAVGIVNLADVVLGNRIASTFQYPNTLAALMMALFFIVTGLQSQEENSWKKYFYATSGFLMIFTFIFTYSRAAWMMLPIFALLYIAFAPGKSRTDGIFYMIAVAVPNILILQPFTSSLSAEEANLGGIIIVAVGMLVFAVLYMGLEIVKRKLTEKHQRLIYVLLAVIFVAAGGFVYVALNITEPLTFDNTTVSENRTNQIQRTIQQVDPLSQYELQLQVESTSIDESQWPWRVQIYGVDEAGQRQLLEQRIGEINESGEVRIPFDTLERTTDVVLYLRNQHPETKVTFEQVSLYDNQDNLIKDVKLSYKYLPETLVSRFNAIDLSEGSSTTRFAYYRDSLSIFKEHPLIGAGGGAWSGIYTKYQSEPYHSTEAHNYYSQTLVETGMVGITLITGLIVLIATLGYYAMKGKNIVQYSIVMGIIALLGHSAIDFNFSYLSIALILWVLIGLLDVTPLKQLKGLKSLKEREFKVGGQLSALVITLPLLLVTLSFYSAHQASGQGIYAMETGDHQRGFQLLESAVTRDPFNENLRLDYAQVLRGIVTEDGQANFMKEAEEQLLNAEKYAPYKPEVLQRLAGYYLSTGNFAQAEVYVEKLVQIAPLRESSYEVKANIYSAIGDYYLSESQDELALQMYEKVLEVIEDLRRTNQELDKPFSLTSEMMSQVFNARYIVENIDSEEKLANLDNIIFSAYLDIHVSEENTLPQGWWTWNREGGEVKVKVTEEGANVTNVGTDLGILLSPRLELNPSKTYGVDVQISSDVKDDDIQIVVHSRSGTATQFSQRSLGEPMEGNLYRFTFETTDDIEPGGQDIRFYHYGDSEQSFTVNQVMIYEIE